MTGLRRLCLSAALLCGCGFYPFDPAVPKALQNEKARTILSGRLSLWLQRFDGSVLSLEVGNGSFVVSEVPELANLSAFIPGSEGYALDAQRRLTPSSSRASGVLAAAHWPGGTECYVRADRAAVCLDNNLSEYILTAPGSAQAITATTEQVCVVRTSGEVDCFAIDEGGAFGPAQRIAGIRGATAIASAMDTASTTYTCALVNDEVDRGRVRCWGANYSGQLGSGVVTTQSLGPQTVQDARGNELAGVTQIDVKSGRGCAVDEKGSVWCWGTSVFAHKDSRAAAQVAKLRTATLVSIGGWMDCALLMDATVACWGDGRTIDLNPALFFVPLPN